MKLSIIIPAHNEERRLPPVLDAYAAFFSERMGEEAEILLVINGSTDNTVAIAQEIAGKHSNTKVIDEPRRIGKGAAVILGVKEAAGQHIGFVDADGSTSPVEFFRLYEKACHGAGVIASRWMKGADVEIPQKAIRLLSSRVFNGLARILLGLKYQDTQCGAKIFTAEAWQAILPDIGTTRFAFDVDMLFQLKRHGYTIKEEPTVWKDVEGSKVQISSSAEMLFAVVRMRLLFSPLKFIVAWYDNILDRTMEYLLKDSLFRHIALLFFASIISAVCNIGYQMVVGRVLPKEDFTLLATFLAFLSILARPLATVSTALNRYTSLLVMKGHMGTTRRLLLKWMALTGMASISVAVLCGVLSEQIASLFHIGRVAPVLVSAIALPAIFLAPVLGGALQGLQRFAWVSLSGVISAIGRILFASVFVLLAYPACGWALAGHVGGLYVGLLASLAGLLPLVLKTQRNHAQLPRLRLYMARCFLFQLAAGVLMSGDVILVRYYLPEETDFAYAATCGRMVAFMAASVVTAMFPKVTSDKEFTQEHRSLYLRSQLYTAGFIGFALVMCLVFPEQFLRFLFRISEPGGHLLGQTRWMGCTMALAAMLNINVHLLLAQRRFKLLISLLGSSLFYIVASYVCHTSVYWIVFFAGAANLFALLATTIRIIRL